MSNVTGKKQAYIVVVLMIMASLLLTGMQVPPAGREHQGVGFSFHLPANYRLTDRMNDGLVLTFENEACTIKVFNQILPPGTGAATYIDYSNIPLYQGKAGFVLKENIIRTDKGLKVREISYSRPLINNRANDRNCYREVHLIDEKKRQVLTFWGKAAAENEPALLNDLKMAVATLSWNGKSPLDPTPVVMRHTSPHIRYEGERLLVDIPPGKIVWGRFFPGYPGDPAVLQEMEKSEKELGHKFEFIMDYKAFLVGDPFPEEAVKRAYQNGRLLMLTLQPFSPDLNWIAIPEIIGGKYDQEIRQWAQGCKNLKEPIFIRPLNEMNGDWDPWCAWFYGKDTQLFIDAWRHIVDIFRETGADNALFVWNPHDRSYPAFEWNNAHLYYPGDDYVDWVGLTGYNNGTSHPGDVWREFDEIYRPLYADYLRRYPAKPFMITEFSCNEVGGSKAAWIEKGLASLAQNYGNIKIVTWFDKQDNLWLYQLASSPQAYSAFAGALAEENFLSGAVTTKKVNNY